MKVLLIEPPKTVWDLMGGNCVCPPPGLAQLAVVLEKEDIDVDIVDCNASEMSWSGLEDKTAKIQPDVIGAIVLTPFFYTALKTVEIAKEVDRRIVTVLGDHTSRSPRKKHYENIQKLM